MSLQSKCLGPLIVILVAVVCFSCKEDPKPAPKPAEKKNVKVPTFSPESAYDFVADQMAFGPRVPGTDGHTACKEWIIAQMKSFGAEVTNQDFTADFHGRKGVPSTNIIAKINPNHPKRILLAAHWDTRAISEKEEDASLKSLPTPGADDGGSGVAVLLEVARTIQSNPIDMGVDFVFFDAEDQGDSGDACVSSCSWCLGSQYWATNVDKSYSPIYGILFDMVGRKNASFHKEGISMVFAPTQTDKIWTLASRMGYSDYFIDQRAPQITDDHRFVNQIAKIPMLNIINLKPENQKETHIFQKCHHTQCDDMDAIDKRTLRAVGQVTTAVLYKESGNTL